MPDKRQQRLPADATGETLHYACIFFLADHQEHKECAKNGFKKLTGLRSHIEDRHIPMVQCPRCPPNVIKRYRDNGRLKDHLQRDHRFSKEDADAYHLVPKPKLDVVTGFWQDWLKMWNFFCPGLPEPPTRYRTINGISSLRKIIEVVDANENSGKFDPNTHIRVLGTLNALVNKYEPGQEQFDSFHSNIIMPLQINDTDESPPQLSIREGARRSSEQVMEDDLLDFWPMVVPPFVPLVDPEVNPLLFDNMQTSYRQASKWPILPPQNEPTLDNRDEAIAADFGCSIAHSYSPSVDTGRPQYGSMSSGSFMDTNTNPDSLGGYQPPGGLPIPNTLQHRYFSAQPLTQSSPNSYLPGNGNSGSGFSTHTPLHATFNSNWSGTPATSVSLISQGLHNISPSGYGSFPTKMVMSPSTSLQSGISATVCPPGIQNSGPTPAAMSRQTSMTLPQAVLSPMDTIGFTPLASPSFSHETLSVFSPRAVTQPPVLINFESSSACLLVVPCTKTITSQKVHEVDLPNEPFTRDLRYWNTIFHNLQALVTKEYALYDGHYELFVVDQVNREDQLNLVEDASDLMTRRRLFKKRKDKNDFCNDMEVRVVRKAVENDRLYGGTP